MTISTDADRKAAGPETHCWRVPGWGWHRGLRHGFLGRGGGFSAPPFASLNLSARVGDDAAAVERNHAAVEAMLSPLRLVLPSQVHGNRIRIVSRPAAASVEADGLVTAYGGIALGVLTADCVPILMVVPEKRLAGVVHAGWRGTALGIARRALAVIRKDMGVDPSELRVAMGPAIGSCCYDVGPDVVAEIEREWGSLPDSMRVRRRGRAHLDLRRINAWILARAGVPPGRICQVGPCTRCTPSRLFSHRASGGRPAGRQLSFVGWE